VQLDDAAARRARPPRPVRDGDPEAHSFVVRATDGHFLARPRVRRTGGSRPPVARAQPGVAVKRRRERRVQRRVLVERFREFVGVARRTRVRLQGAQRLDGLVQDVHECFGKPPTVSRLGLNCRVSEFKHRFPERDARARGGEFARRVRMSEARVEVDKLQRLGEGSVVVRLDPRLGDVPFGV